MALHEREDWIQFSKSFDSSWQKLAVRLHKMDAWRQNELADANTGHPVVFYPFSGPDFLNAFTFFPSASRLVMVGLEPAGSVPDFNQLAKDTLTGYFKSIRHSLTSIMKFSFFRTLSMEKDLKSVELDGTLPVMLIFMVRTGNTIVNVKPVSLAHDGTVMVKDFDKNHHNPYRGVRVQYLTNQDTMVRELTYFSADIGDAGLSRDSTVLQFVKSYPFSVTYLKSASYLMHKSYFAKIRSTILTKTQRILQDDSGIPYRYLANDRWKCQAYGTYDKPIKLFSNWYQADYRALFEDTVHVKPLTFGIGYDWRPNESNLLYAVKIVNK